MGFVLAALASFGVAAPAAGMDAESFVPVGTLALVATAPLAITPEKLVLSDGSAFVIGQSDDGRGHVLVLAADTLATTVDRPVDIVPQDIAVSADGRTVFVIGTDGTETRLAIFDRKLDPVAGLAIGDLVDFPSISVTAADVGRLVVGGVQTDRSDPKLFSVDVSDPANPTRTEPMPGAPARHGVTAAWYSQSDETVFLNVAGEAVLLAVDEPTGRTLSDISFVLKSGRGIEPFSTLALLSDRPCREAADPSFLISDAGRDRLILAGYDPYFRSLDLQAEVEPRLRIVPGSKPVSWEGTDILQPSGLVASSCDQSVVWLGNRYSDEIIQFAVNPDVVSLEKVGTIDLPAPPTGLAVSEDGSFALAILQTDKVAMRFASVVEAAGAAEPGVDLSTATTRTVTRGLTLIGDPTVRELQRLLIDRGYPVGSIDGMIGPNTSRAAAQYSAQTGTELDIENDLEGALRAIRGVDG